MSRPTKQGVDYFPLDIHLDDKFKFIEIKYKLEGFAIIIKLLQKIYDSGYWYRFSEDEMLLFSGEINVDINTIQSVVNEAINRDIFNKNLFDKYQILTSKGIQKRYEVMVKRRKDVEVIKEFKIIDDNFGINEIIKSIDVCNNSTSNEVNDNKSTQSKVKESKVKESKEDIVEIDYNSILDYYHKTCPSLSKVRVLDDKRKKHIRVRIKEHGKKALKEVFDKVESSDFLTGKKTDWKANFDFLISPSGFIKTLEGAYDNNSNKKANVRHEETVPGWMEQHQSNEVKQDKEEINLEELKETLKSFK